MELPNQSQKVIGPHTFVAVAVGDLKAHSPMWLSSGTQMKIHNQAATIDGFVCRSRLVKVASRVRTMEKFLRDGLLQARSPQIVFSPLMMPRLNVCKCKIVEVSQNMIGLPV